jgi:hypothetical protein
MLRVPKRYKDILWTWWSCARYFAASVGLRKNKCFHMPELVTTWRCPHVTKCADRGNRTGGRLAWVTVTAALALAWHAGNGHGYGNWLQVRGKFKLPALARQMQQSGRDLKLYRCSVCQESWTSYKNCQQHCSQPHSRCNRGRRPQDFATVIESDIQFRASDRQVGGRMRDVDPLSRALAAPDPCELHDVQPLNDVSGRDTRA